MLGVTMKEVGLDRHRRSIQTEPQTCRGEFRSNWHASNFGLLGSSTAAFLTSAPYMVPTNCADELKAIREISFSEER